MDAETPTLGQGTTRRVGAAYRLSRWARIALASAVVVSLAGGVF